MLVIGCTVSLMSWGRGCCTQPTPWEYCDASSSASVELGTVGRWEASLTGQGVLHPHRVLSLRVGRAACGGTVGTPECACTTQHLSCAWDRHCSQSRAGLCKQTLQVFEVLVSGTELLGVHTASCSLTWRGTGSSARAILLSEELSKPSVRRWRSWTLLRCSAEPKFLKVPLVLTRQQLSTSGSQLHFATQNSLLQLPKLLFRLQNATVHCSAISVPTVPRAV